jgi:hypothetical protein
VSSPSLFDDRLNAPLSQAAAKAGAEQAYDNAVQKWKDQADDVMHWCASNYVRFISDQFWARCAATHVPEPPDRRAFSGVVARAKREGWITTTTEYQNSERVAAHSGPKRIYQSHLRREDPQLFDVEPHQPAGSLDDLKAHQLRNEISFLVSVHGTHAVEAELVRFMGRPVNVPVEVKS